MKEYSVVLHPMPVVRVSAVDYQPDSIVQYPARVIAGLTLLTLRKPVTGLPVVRPPLKVIHTGVAQCQSTVPEEPPFYPLLFPLRLKTVDNLG